MVLDTGSVILCVAGLFLLYLFCWFFLKPLKWLFRLFISFLLGGAAIVVFNFIGAYLGWHISLNPLSALISGVMGAPGMALIYILSGLL